MIILNSWKMLTRDQGILSVGYKIPVSIRAHQKKNTMKYPYDCSTGEIGGYGNFRDADKGSYLSGLEGSKERFSEQYISCWGTRLVLSPSYQSEETKQTCALPAIQYGRFIQNSCCNREITCASSL